MVKAREQLTDKLEDFGDLEEWFLRLNQLSPSLDHDSIIAACETSYFTEKAAEKAATSDDAWALSPSCFRTGLEMAEILAEFQLDTETIQAAILYRGLREGKLKLSQIREQFGDAVATLSDGVLKMAAISIRTSTAPTDKAVVSNQKQVENLRSMLLSLVDDVRVALIKLAERTCMIRAVKNRDRDRQYRVAKEVFEVYAPLAHRLGIGQLKWELEDLAFRYLEPVTYKNIAHLLDEKRLARESYINDVVDSLANSLETSGITADISGRAKHIYSIWRKMQRKKIGFSQLNDIRAVRVLTGSVRECYEVLGIVHRLWNHIPNEFDDYIATPKENGYRSLHTAVVGPEGQVIEIQIRTQQMHEEAEYGVCAHWTYKETNRKGVAPRPVDFDSKTAWLRQALELHDEVGDPNNLQDELHGYDSESRVYAFTPDGHVISVPLHATALDFAYYVHTEVGHSYRGAKVNGRIVTLSYQLKTGDMVEVLTRKDGHPKRDWLNENLGYLNTARARSKVRQWFSAQNHEQNILDGRLMLEREFRRLAVSPKRLKETLHEYQLTQLDELYAEVGRGNIPTTQIVRATQLLYNAASRNLELPFGSSSIKVPASPATTTTPQSLSGIQVRGVGNLMTHIAECCTPSQEDGIIGYITKARGVTIHRQDCGNLVRLDEVNPDRIIEVSWGQVPEKLFVSNIMISAYDRSGLLRDVTAILAEQSVNIIAVSTSSEKSNHTASMELAVETSGFQQLGAVLSKINQLPNVVEARRIAKNG
ncbi:MAG: GTP diphosphokinase [Pseudomonadales bacterium]|nr:GTP diphosphokinase [Pseudomonadales bacterium]